MNYIRCFILFLVGCTLLHNSLTAESWWEWAQDLASTILPTGTVTRTTLTTSREFPIAPDDTVTIILARGQVTLDTWKESTVICTTTHWIKNSHEQQQCTITCTSRPPEPRSQKKHHTLTIACPGKAAYAECTIFVPESAHITLIIEEWGDAYTRNTALETYLTLNRGNLAIESHSPRTVYARSEEGNITMNCHRWNQAATLILTAPHGTVALATPETSLATVDLHIQRGSIQSKHPITIEAQLLSELTRTTHKTLLNNVRGVLGKPTLHIEPTAHIGIDAGKGILLEIYGQE